MNAMQVLLLHLLPLLHSHSHLITLTHTRTHNTHTQLLHTRPSTHTHIHQTRTLTHNLTQTYTKQALFHTILHTTRMHAHYPPLPIAQYFTNNNGSYRKKTELIEQIKFNILKFYTIWARYAVQQLKGLRGEYCLSPKLETKILSYIFAK